MKGFKLDVGMDIEARKKISTNEKEIREAKEKEKMLENSMNANNKELKKQIDGNKLNIASLTKKIDTANSSVETLKKDLKVTNEGLKANETETKNLKDKVAVLEGRFVYSKTQPKVKNGTIWLKPIEE